MGIDEETLVGKAKGGDGDAFGKLLEIYASRLLGVAISITRNRAEAEEAVQEAAIQAFRSIGSLENDWAFGSWFTRIAFNKAIDRLRRSRPERERTTSYGLDLDAAGASGDIEGKLDISVAIERLPPDNQAVIRLYYGMGYSTPEIAELLGRPQGTIRWLLSESYRLLRLILHTANLV